MIIIVSGTPGTGKSRMAKELAKAIRHTYVDVKRIIAERRLSLGYDRKRKCEIIDPKALNKILINLIKADKELVIDSHLSHYLPKRYVGRCIITTCGLKELEKRLEKRGYSREKVRENLDSEIFEVCRSEALEAGHSVIVIDTTKGYDLDNLIKKLGVVRAR
jgi:adenylate kinase